MPKDADSPSLPLNSKHWKSNGLNGVRSRLRCLICNDAVWRQPKHCPKHEKTDKHKDALLVFEQHANSEGSVLVSAGHASQYTTLSSTFESLASSVPGHTSSLSSDESSGVVGTLGNVIRHMNSAENIHVDLDYSIALQDSEADYDVLDGSGIETPPTNENLHVDFAGFHHSIFDTILSDASDALEAWLASGPSVDTYSDEDEDIAPIDDPESEDYTPDVNLIREMMPSQRKSKLIENAMTSDWYPWPNKVFCVLDILRHLPRSVFSDRQNNLISWAMTTFGVPQIPAESSIKTMTESLQLLCGVQTKRCDGALGHLYYSNNIRTLIAQEMANPRVRPFLNFFPEDSGPTLSDAYQAKRWLHDMDPELLTPVIKQDYQDYFIFEPSILIDQSICMPVRWFKRSGVMYARAWRMLPATRETTVGWIVTKYDCIEVPVSKLAASFPYFAKSFYQRGLPDPTIIFGTVDEEGGVIQQWTTTDSTKGNRWRELSKGHPVYAFPIWLYCDDTSGNTSKRWNKHNSFLFIPAGLSHKYVHLEYNIQFLSTSNLAEPLEMAEEIVDGILEGQKNGIWAWDCQASEVVMLIPSVLALLGDNPMQSEFACHIGLNGKYFCRICYVCNPTVEDQEDEIVPVGPVGSMRANEDAEGEGNNSEAASDSGQQIENAPEGGSSSGNTSAAKAAGRKKKQAKKKPAKKKKSPETLAQLVARAQDFLKIAGLRDKNTTITDLKEIYTHATSLGGITKTKTLKTDKGIKDTYQDFFIEKSLAYIRDVRTNGENDESKRKRIREFTKTIPTNPLNPLFKIPGLDPHCHSPVEILHVVLLGFAKYFWRDAMSRIDKKKKPLLIARLSSLDTTGLGISPIAGKNLVQWSGSLVGRDFRVVVQVAPLVLYDLLPDECYQAWLALSALIPLVWQPVIIDLDNYLIKLQRAIDRFLNLTAKLTPRWFNKPKFHLLLHLPQHVRIFGPAILFATETFESYNAIIRDLSVHSNRQAPSRDIGRGFANMNRIRHLTSGGKFHMADFRVTKLSQDIAASNTPTNTGTEHRDAAADTAGYFQSAGKNVKEFIDENPLLQKLINFPGLEEVNNGNIRRDDSRTRKWTETRAAKIFGESTNNTEQITNLKENKYIGYKSCNLQNGDNCALNSWVIARKFTGGSFFIGRVSELLQVSRSTDFHKEPDLILLSVYSTDIPSSIYQMPKVTTTGNYALVEFSNVMCSAHVVHNCAENNCTLSAFRAQKQERADTDQKVPDISHVKPDDWILNCNKMRDFRFTQEFCIEPPIPDRDDCIHRGAIQEINARRKKAAQDAAASGAATQENIRSRTTTNEGATRQADSHVPQGSFGNIPITFLNNNSGIPHTVPVRANPLAASTSSPGEINQRQGWRAQPAAHFVNPLERVRGQR